MVNKWLAGIHRGHQIADAPWFGGQLLSQVKKGATRLAPTSSQWERCQPVTLKHLDALWQCLVLSNSFDAAVYAIACVAFWACCRLGELLILSHHGFNLQKNVSRGC